MKMRLCMWLCFRSGTLPVRHRGKCRPPADGAENSPDTQSVRAMSAPVNIPKNFSGEHPPPDSETQSAHYLPARENPGILPEQRCHPEPEPSRSRPSLPSERKKRRPDPSASAEHFSRTRNGIPFRMEPIALSGQQKQIQIRRGELRQNLSRRSAEREFCQCGQFSRHPDFPERYRVSLLL